MIPEEGVYTSKTDVQKAKQAKNRTIRMRIQRFVKMIRKTSWKRSLVLSGVVAIILASSIGYCAYRYNVWSEQWSFHLQLPFQNFIRVEPRVGVSKSFFKRAQAKEMTFEDKIKEAFGKNAPVFLKIAHAESGQNAGSKGYNCMYNGKSRACKPEDREKAWSVDCGALQINVYGRVCPVELYDLDKNLEAAVGKFNRQGFGAWSVCKNGTVDCRIV